MVKSVHVWRMWFRLVFCNSFCFSGWETFFFRYRHWRKSGACLHDALDFSVIQAWTKECGCCLENYLFALCNTKLKLFKHQKWPVFSTGFIYTMPCFENMSAQENIYWPTPCACRSSFQDYCYMFSLHWSLQILICSCYPHDLFQNLGTIIKSSC